MGSRLLLPAFLVCLSLLFIACGARTEPNPAPEPIAPVISPPADTQTPVPSAKFELGSLVVTPEKPVAGDQIVEGPYVHNASGIAFPQEVGHFVRQQITEFNDLGVCRSDSSSIVRLRDF